MFQYGDSIVVLAGVSPLLLLDSPTVAERFCDTLYRYCLYPVVRDADRLRRLVVALGFSKLKPARGPPGHSPLVSVRSRVDTFHSFYKAKHVAVASREVSHPGRLRYLYQVDSEVLVPVCSYVRFAELRHKLLLLYRMCLPFLYVGPSIMPELQIELLAASVLPTMINR